MTFEKVWTPERQRAAIDYVLDEIGKGRALGRILTEDENLPSISLWYLWQQNLSGLLAEVAHARELGATTLLEQIVDIADTQELGEIRVTKPDGTVEVREEDMLGHRKLRIYAREKYAQMIAPRRFGAKLDVTSDGEKLPTPQTNIGIEKVQALVQLAISRKNESPIDEETRKLFE